MFGPWGLKGRVSVVAMCPRKDSACSQPAYFPLRATGEAPSESTCSEIWIVLVVCEQRRIRKQAKRASKKYADQQPLDGAAAAAASGIASTPQTVATKSNDDVVLDTFSSGGRGTIDLE
jgi:hypothetical protein